MDGINLDTTRFAAAMQQLAALTHRELEVEMRSQAKGIIVEAYNITPPATGRGRGDKAAAFDSASQLRGERAIDRDLRGIFVPVELRGERTITQAFGRPIAPVTVPTKEKHPDVAAIYATRDARRRGGRMTRGQRAAYYVDRAKLEALARQLKARVGFLAAGFNAAAAALGARVPKYARNKSAPGGITITAQPNRIRIVFTNEVGYTDAVPGLKARLQYALDQQARKIERQIPILLAKAAKQSGFKTAA